MRFRCTARNTILLLALSLGFETAHYGILAAPVQEVPPAGVRISGKVTRPGKDEPPPAVRIVTLTGIRGGAPPLRASVDLEGTFAFADVPPGSYSVRTEPFFSNVPNGPVVTVADVDITDLNLIVPATFRLRGQVVVEGSGAIPNLSLSLTGAYGSFAALGPSQSSITVLRADNSSFDLTLPEGEYRVLLTGVPSTHIVRSVTRGETDLLTRSLTLDGEGDSEEIRVVLAPRPGAPLSTIRGRAIDAGNPLPLDKVVLSSPALNSQMEAKIQEDGSFEFAGVPPGVYTATVSPGVTDRPVEIVVTGGDVSGVEIVRPRQVDVTGRVIVDADGPAPRLSVSFIGESGTTPAFNQADGIFRTVLPAGEYRLAIGPIPPPFTLTSAAFGAVDLLTDTLKLDGSPYADIRIGIGFVEPDPWVKLSGRVIDAANLAPGRNTVTLSGAFSVPPAPIQSDGSFEFPRVLPGSYSLILQAASFRAVPVTIDRQDVTGIELRVPRQIPVVARIELDGSGPIPRIGLTFRGDAGNILPDSGALRAVLTEDRYHVLISYIPAHYRLEAISEGAVDLLAQPLDLTESDSAEIVVTLAMATPGVRVRGRITGRENINPADLPLYLNGLDIQPYPAAVSPDGSFEFAAVPPGDYTVYLPAAGMSVPIVVGSVDIAGLEVSGASNQVQIRGRIVIEGDAPLPRPSIVLRGPDAGIFGFTLVGPAVDSEGTFQMSVDPGDYGVGLENLPPGYRVKSVAWEASDLLRGPLPVRSDAVDILIVLEVVAVPRSVGGRVIGVPNPGMTGSILVSLSGGGLTYTATLRPDGSFLFPSVFPGRYEARAGADAGATIDVADTDIADLALNYIPPPVWEVLAGRVIVEGGGPIPQIYLNGNPANHYSSGVFWRFLRGRTYPVNVSHVPPGYHVKELTYGPRDLLGSRTPVDVSEGHELRIVLERTPEIATYGISGRLLNFVDAGWPSPLLSFTAPDRTFQTPVHPDGTFALTGATPGDYAVYLRPDGAYDIWGEVLRLQSSIRVPDGGLAGLEFEVPPIVPGRIVTSDGSIDSEFLHLRIFRFDSNGRHETAREINGAFRIHMNDGDRLSVDRIPYGFRVASLTYGRIDLLQEPFRFTEPPDAQIVIALAPDTPSEPVYRVRGRVVNAAADAGPAHVILTNMTYSTSNEHLHKRLETAAGPDGGFEFGNLPPGVYSVHVADAPGPAVSKARFAIFNEDVDGVVIAIPDWIEAAGRITVDDGNALPDLNDAILIMTPAVQTDEDVVSFATNVSRDGRFTLVLAAGSHRFSLIGLPAGYALKSITYGAADLLTGSIVPPAAQPPSEIQIVLSKTESER